MPRSRRLPVLLSLLIAGLASLCLAGPAAAAVTGTTTDYGSFTIPAGAGDPHDHDTMGMIPNRQINDIAKPCINCTIVGARPELVYADGTTANLDTGPMLHHAVFSAKGGGKSDAVCGGSERFFASGNERTTFDVSALPYGYKVGKSTESWSLLIDLMNWSLEAKTVSLRINWSYVTGSEATARKPLRPVWNGMNVCGNAEFPVPYGPSATSADWTTTVPGSVITTIGHVHDHGVSVESTNVTRGTGVCTSFAGFGETPGFVTPDGRKHISSMSQCTGAPVATLRKGDVLRTTARYDVPATHHAIDDAMGIMILYVAP